MSADGVVRYARSTGNVRIAFRVSGSGPPLLEVGGFGALFSIDAVADQPRWARFEARLATFSRLVRVDLRNFGLSDPAAGPIDIDAWVEDLIAVLDAERVDECVVLGSGYGGLPALQLAASHPERVKGLVLANAFARVVHADDYPAGVPERVLARLVTSVEEADSADGGDIDLMAPSVATELDTRTWWTRAASHAAPPTAALKLWELLASCDARAAACAVAARTCVLQTTDNQFIRPAHALWLTENIPHARLVMVRGRDHVLWAHPRSDLLDEIEEFVTGERSTGAGLPQLAAILFTDLVGSTDHNAKAGDAEWANAVARHDALCAREIRRFGGHVLKTMGDGVLATFSNASSGVQAGAAIATAGEQAGFEIRVGLHAAEIERRDGDVFGIGVAIAARILSHAEPNRLTVTRTVVDLLVGGTETFDSATSVTFKGVPGTWELFVLR
jgi:class 3 adenylate cyclase